MEDKHYAVQMKAGFLAQGAYDLCSSPGITTAEVAAAVAAYPGRVALPSEAAVLRTVFTSLPPIDGRESLEAVFDFVTVQPCEKTLRLRFRGVVRYAGYSADIVGIDLVDQPSLVAAPAPPKAPQPGRARPPATKPVYGNKIPRRYWGTIREALDSLVRGDRPELLTWVAPEELLRQPDEIFLWAQSVIRGPEGLEIDLPLWTKDHSPSDLTAQIVIGRDGKATISDVHVM